MACSISSFDLFDAACAAGEDARARPFRAPTAHAASWPAPAGRASSCSSLLSRSREATSVSFCSASRSISSCRIAARDLVQLGRHRVDLGAQARGGLVDEVDRLVGEEPVGDVAMGQHGGGHQGGVLDADAVVDLVALLEPAQDRDGVLHRRLVHHHRLEAPLEGGVLLDVLACTRRGSWRRCSAARPGPASASSRLLASMAPSAAPAPTTVCNSSMKRMISPCESSDLLQHGLQALLELAAILGPGDQRAHVERDDALVLEPFGHVAAHDPLGQSLDDRRLADAGAPTGPPIIMGASTWPPSPQRSPRPGKPGALLGLACALRAQIETAHPAGRNAPAFPRQAPVACRAPA